MFFKKVLLSNLIIEKWKSISPASKSLFYLIMILQFASFGFEMTNLAFNHDDTTQFLFSSPYWAWSSGRWALGLFRYYVLNSYFMPFLSFGIAFVLMYLYGLMICKIWEVNDGPAMVFLIGILVTFPYMSNAYSYNTSVVPFALAHCLAALGVFFSLKKSLYYFMVSIVFICISVSIYQSLLLNILVIMGFVLFFQIFKKQSVKIISLNFFKMFLSVAFGSIFYYISIKLSLYFSGIKKLTTYQGADKMFEYSFSKLHLGFLKSIALYKNIFLKQQSYFPSYAKNILLALFVIAITSIIIKKCSSPIRAIMLSSLLICLSFIPCVLQVIHPAGRYHVLTLTSVAVLFAGITAIIFINKWTFLKNISVILIVFVLYIFACENNRKSVISLQSTRAEQMLASRMLARAEALPEYFQMEKKTFVFIGKLPRHEIDCEYPFLSSVGVGGYRLNGPRGWAVLRLLRTKVYPPTAKQIQVAKDHIKSRRGWPHLDSVFIVDNIVVVILSNPQSCQRS